MTEWQTLTNKGDEFKHVEPDPGRRSLNRLRWGLRATALIGIGLWELWNILVFQRSFREIIVGMAWGAILSLGLIQICFRFVFRLYDRTATLTRVSQAISSKLTQEDLLPYLAQSLARVLDSTGCLIVLRQPRMVELEPVATYGSCSENGPSHLIPNGYLSLSRALMQTQQPIVIEDVNDSAHFSPEAVEYLTDKSLLGLPLMAKGQVIGAAVVGESRRQRRFPQSEIDRAMVVANQGAVAIANAHLFQEAEQRLVEFGTLAELSRVIVSPFESPDIYQGVVDELARAFGYPFVAFYQAENEQLELRAQVGYDAERLPTHISFGDGLIGNAASTGETGYVPDIDALPESKKSAPDIVSQIALPLRKDGRVLGVLSVESFTFLTEADLSLLQSVSYQVSTAIENARLYAAEQRGREISDTLLQIAGDLSGTLHLDEVLNLILERLRVVVPYESAAIGLLAGGVCYIAAAQDVPDADLLWGMRLSPDNLPMIARVLSKRTVAIITDTHQSDEWVPIKGSEDVRSWLGVPLAVQDRTIGLLMLNHITPGFYNQHAARLALAFAQHAALAIDNARLYEQAQAALREQMLLHEMTTAVSSTLDAGRVLRLLAERLTTVLGVTSVRIATLGGDMQTANLVAEHCAADADDAEQESSIGEIYELDAFPITTDKLMKRQPLLVTAGDEPEEWCERIIQRAGLAMLLLPLVARDRVTGFVELWDSRSQRHFTEAEIKLAHTLINPAAVAIDNARLFAETQRSVSEMMLLYDIAVASASTLELNTILQSVVKTLQFRVLEGSVVNVWLVDPAQDALRLRAYAGELEELSRKQTLQLDEDICGQVIQTGQPVLIGDCQQESCRQNYGPAVRSILCVPLARGRQVIGVLQALSAQVEAFSNHDLRLLRTMAGSLAIAVENVRLFAELKRSEEALVLRNQALKSANDRLTELDRLKSAFIASVSHELRTPLNSIIGFSEVLMDGLAGELQPLAHQYLGFIHSSGKHLLDLIDDILDLSKIQAGRMTLTLEPVDVIVVVRDVQATLAPMITQKKQLFEVEQEESLPTIIADPFRLKQILLNLTSNACKYTQEGAKITVRAFLADPATLRLDVADDGPGIDLEDQLIIFEEFRQARTTRPGEGTGLGLAITRRLVELHSGRIWLDSELGSGATFTVLLPTAGPEPEETEEKELYDIAD